MGQESSTQGHQMATKRGLIITNHWSQMAIEIGLVDIKHVMIETFGHFWLL
jgi:hypothetical protein